MRQHTKFLLGSALFLSAVLAVAETAIWPVQPVRLIVPAAAGSPPDIVGRIVAQRLGTSWGKQVIVDNKPGAGGVIGLSSLKQAHVDGHTFALAQAATVSVAPYLAPNDRYDVGVDFVPVGLVAIGPLVLVAEKSFPVDTAGAFIAMAKQSATPINVGVNGQNSLPHLAALAMKRDAGLNINIVPFSSSGGAVTAVVNGDVQVMLDGIPGVDSMLRSKKIKALAVTSKTRLPNEPNIPSLAESIPGTDVNGWFVVYARKGTETSVIEKFNRDLNQAVDDGQVRARFSELGVQPGNLSVMETEQFVARERSRWSSLITSLQIKAQ
jgi:tripartite-type tricarboxylate transporter receptor subunit TctC